MKNFTLTLLLMAGVWSVHAQLNMSLMSQVQYNDGLSDVWGWAAPDGTEYALVGLQNGFSIVSLEDPTNAEEVAFIPGPSSTWRDIKTNENVAYVSNETGEGLLVVDLSNLPDNFSDDDWYYWAPNIPEAGGTLSSIHNLYADEFGYLYIAGSNLNGGGLLYIDVFTDPFAPVYVGQGPSVYSHDIFVRDNIAYSSDIFAGYLSIHDVTDKTNSVQLATQTTPFAFTHNAWLSDDSQTVFTTDEQGNAPIAAYDISDFNDIVELDQFRPLSTIGLNVIPHNVHVFNDWLAISYYTDGGIVADASRPNNIIETANFDTFFGGNGGFSGAWGLYPFLPSEIILVSDIGNGLYVLDVEYVRACWLEGKVTDAVSGLPIPDADVDIDSEQVNMAATDLNGDYETGQAISGTFDVTFTRAGYQTLTVPAELNNGEVTILDVQLQPLQSFSLTGQTINDENGNPVPDAVVFIENEVISYAITTDASGNFSLNVLGGDYTVTAGKWGFNEVVADLSVTGASTLTLELPEGYKDDFVIDQGWSSTGNAATGIWVRDIPIGTDFNGAFSNPGEDIPNDLGERCYVTGNGGGGAGNDDVDDGTVTLTSPVMDLSSLSAPVISYRTWFFNDGGNGTPNDELTVRISNGSQTVIVETISNSQSLWRPTSQIQVADFISITDDMRISFETSDAANSGHLVEAGVDQFLVTDAGGPSNTFDQQDKVASLSAFPNPFKETLTVNYQLNDVFQNATMLVFNGLGQKVKTIALNGNEGTLSFGQDLSAGVYMLQVVAEGRTTQSVRVLKAK